MRCEAWGGTWVKFQFSARLLGELPDMLVPRECFARDALELALDGADFLVGAMVFTVEVSLSV